MKTTERRRGTLGVLILILAALPDPALAKWYNPGSWNWGAAARTSADDQRGWVVTRPAVRSDGRIDVLVISVLTRDPKDPRWVARFQPEDSKRLADQIELGCLLTLKESSEEDDGGLTVFTVPAGEWRCKAWKIKGLGRGSMTDFVSTWAHDIAGLAVSTRPEDMKAFLCSDPGQFPKLRDDVLPLCRTVEEVADDCSPETVSVEATDEDPDLVVLTSTTDGSQLAQCREILEECHEIFGEVVLVGRHVDGALGGTDHHLGYDLDGEAQRGLDLIDGYLEPTDEGSER